MKPARNIRTRSRRPGTARVTQETAKPFVQKGSADRSDPSSPTRVLVIGVEEAAGSALVQDLSAVRWCALVSGLTEAAGYLGDLDIALVLVRVRTGERVEPVIRWIRHQSRRADVPVVVIGDDELDAAMSAMHGGATDYLTRSSPRVEIVRAVERAIRVDQIRRWAESIPEGVGERRGLVGRSRPMCAVAEQLDVVAPLEVSLLLVGETGTGKEVVAREVHQRSPRAGGPLVVVPCAAIPEALAESELFGHAKGAFTGAASDRVGMLSAARGGTLLLDDVDATPLAVQAKLLRALQEKSIRPVGAAREQATDFRLLSSTNRDLEALVRAGAFREDLFYRIAVVEIRLPPLRERGLDVLELAQTFLESASARAGGDRKVRGFSPAAAERLLSYDWPGNVRELESCIAQAVAVARFDHITEQDLPSLVAPSDATDESSDDRWERVEKRHLLAVLDATTGNKTEAARRLGIDRKTLLRKMARHGIDTKARRGGG